MSSIDLMLELVPRNIDHLNESASLTTFLTEVVHRGYLVLPRENAYKLVEELGVAHAWKPRIMDEVQQPLADYVAGTSDIFDCYLRFCPPPGKDYGLLFRMTLYRGQSILIGFNDNTFSYNVFGLRNYERFIEFITLVYQFWPLLYGYMSDGPSWEIDEIRNLEVDALYELTIFGPEYVAKIGREKFNTLHAWRTLRMEDGGYIVAVGVYARSCGLTLPTYPKAVAQELGLDSPDFMDF